MWVAASAAARCGDNLRLPERRWQKASALQTRDLARRAEAWARERCGAAEAYLDAQSG